MKAVGIVAEYNPFHSGHRYQIRKICESCGAETPIIAVMSGDFVQRAVCRGALPGCARRSRGCRGDARYAE